MTISWIKRKEHTRKLKSGTLTHVKENYALFSSDKKKIIPNSCPFCGAPITSKKMKNGGWVHYEQNNIKIKHPCFSRGQNLSKKRDDDTPDLFTINK